MMGCRRDCCPLCSICTARHITGGEQRRGLGKRRRRVLRVVVLVAVGDAAVPGVVVAGVQVFPLFSQLLFFHASRRAARAVVASHSLQLIQFVVVAGAHIDVLGKGHDRDVDVAGIFRHRTTCRSGFGGGLHRRHFAVVVHRPRDVERHGHAHAQLPQAEVELLPKSSFGNPATFMKSVATLPAPLITIVEPMLLLAV